MPRHGDDRRRRRRAPTPERRRDAPGQLGGRGRLEDGGERQVDAERGAEARDRLRREQRVAAQREEAVVGADAIGGDPEHLGEDRPDRLLHRPARRHVGARDLRAGVGRGERAPVDLAARRERERVEDDDRARHHVRRERRLERAPDRSDHRAVAPRADHVRHDLQVASPVVARHRVGLAHAEVSVAEDRRLDLAQLDAEAADLHLEVRPPEVLDLPRGRPARHVPRPVEPRPRLGGERVRHEALRRQPRPIEVAPPDLHPAQAQLAGQPERRRPSAGVEHVDPHVVDGPPDGHDRAPGRARPVRHVDGRLRGPVEVVQLDPAERLEEAIGERRGQRLAAGEDAAERAAPPEILLLHEGAQHRGHEVHRRHALRGGDVPQVGRIAVPVRPRHDEARAVEQRAEQLPHRDVEADRRLLQDAVARGEAVGVLHPREAVDDRAVRVHRPLGAPGRSRRVDDVRQVLRRERPARQAIRGLGVERVRAGVERDRRGAVLGQHASHASQARLRQDDRGPRVREHEREALPRVVRVERHVRAPRLEHAVERHDHLDRPLHAHPDQRLGADPAPAQRVREPVRPRVEIPVRDRAALERDGERLRGPVHLGLEEIVQAALSTVMREGGVVPALDHLPALGLREHGQGGEGAIGGVGDALEQRRQVAEHALDDRRVEAPRVVAQLQRERAPEHREQRERDARALDRARLPHRDPARPLPQRLLHRVVLEHDHALEERRAPRHGGERLERCQRAVLVVAQRDLLRVDALQPRARRRLRVHVDAHRQRVDEDPDHPVDARQRRRPARHRHAEEHASIPAVPREQHGPRPLRERAERDPALPRERVEPARDLHRQRQPRARPPRRSRRRAIDRDRRRRRHPGQPAPPERLRRLAILPADPGDVLAEGPRLRQRDGRPPRVPLVQREDLADEQRRRPAVEEQVMARPQEAVRPVRDPEQRGAEQRRPAEVEAARPILRGVRLEGARLRVGREPSQILLVDGEGRLPPHDLHRPLEALPHEAGPQDGVPIDDVLPRPEEGGRVDLPPQRPADLDDVHAPLRRVERVEEHPLLHGREGVDVLDVDPAHEGRRPGPEDPAPAGTDRTASRGGREAALTRGPALMPDPGDVTRPGAAPPTRRPPPSP